jgi:hypothetical protein
MKNNIAAMLIASLVCVVVATSGCQERPQTAQHVGVRDRSDRPGPEESFELIVETFRRGVEDVPIGFVYRDAEGHSMMTGRNEVSHRLIPPTNEDEPYKGVITVGSQSRYSIQRSVSEEDDEEKVADNGTSPLDESQETGFEPLDEDLVGGSGEPSRERKKTPPLSENTEKKVTRQKDEQKRNYELVYEDGKWTLVTKLDQETEQSIQNAFDRALSLQL